MYKLENWSTSGPEIDKTMRFLWGSVYNHPKYEDGTKIGTSAIMKVDGKLVTTKSGSIYELGKPLEEFVEWCRQEGCHIPTEKEPIRLLNS